MGETGAPTKDDIIRSAERIAAFANRTPVMTSRTLDERLGAEVFFKCENFQRVGAFKFRGACNAVFSLSEDEARKGVATHSSGNHAAALALAARLRGINAHVAMPSNSSKVKVDAVKDYGAKITFCVPTLEARESTLAEVVARTGAHVVHPYDDVRIIAGQATAAKELLEDVQDLDILIAPVGGGGLLSGTALSAKHWSTGTRVFGAEPAGADDAFRSFEAGKLIRQTDPRTIADGLRTSLSPRTFKIIRENVAGIATVGEGKIIEAMRYHSERMKIVVEPSGAVPLGALLEGKLDVAGKRVGVIISGGNVESKFFSECTS
ncbi:MAG: pyridoxal-phosphate dependent enzyme [Methanobacteriota archaeon]